MDLGSLRAARGRTWIRRRPCLFDKGTTVSATAADAPAPKPKGKKMVIIGAVLVLLLAAGAAAWMLLGRGHAQEEGEEAPPPPKHTQKEGALPTYLPLENMVVNLADPGGERFAQIGVTIEVADQKVADRVKAHMPTIRNAVLMLVSQRTSEELLSKDGKEKLAADILREVSIPLGYEVEDAADDGKTRRKGRRAAYNPILGVLFSSFIIQ